MDFQEKQGTVAKFIKLKILMKNHQIEINRIICTNYAKSLLDFDIDDYMSIEVLPHVPDAWVNESKAGCDKTSGEVGKVGYEINFNRYFYTYTPPRPLEEIEAEILGLQTQINDLMGQLFN